jgi:hypothetical protein
MHEMTDFLLPFPITEIENGALLYYFIFDPTLTLNNKKTGKGNSPIKYQFISYEDKGFCLFNDMYAVPLELFEKLDLKTQKFLYFMKYSIDNLYSEVFLIFEIDEEFLINYKAYKTFLTEYKKKLELEKSPNNQESSLESVDSLESVKENTENKEKIEEKIETLLN